MGDELDGCIFYFMFFIALVGTILPAFLIYNGNRTLNKIEKETDEIVDDVQRTHGYKRSIDSSISLKFENNQDG